MGRAGRGDRDRADQARGGRRPGRRDHARLGAHPLKRLALLAALLAGCGGPNAPEPGTRVDSVRDGDTILLTDGRRVRLVQVDAPELGVECYGDEAMAELRRLVAEGDELRLERDPALDAVDRHGRLLRYVHVDGLSVNVELVRRGAAAPYFYRGERGRHASRLLAAARDARAAGRGLWGACPGARLDPVRALSTG